MNGKDLHTGDLELRAAAGRSRRSASGALTMAGMAMAFAREGSAAGSRSRSSARAARRSASGTRRSTCAPRGGCRRSSASRTTRPRCRRRSRDQSAVRVFADKASGYGVPGVTIDGTDPDEIAAAFAWAVERARAGLGPTLDRAGVDADVRPRASRRHALSRQGCAAVVELPAAHRAGLRRPRAPRVLGGARSDSAYAARLRGRGPHRRAATSRRFKREAEAFVEAQARAVIAAPLAGAGARGRRRVRRRAAARRASRCWIRRSGGAVDLDPALPAVERRGRRSTEGAARSSKGSRSASGTRSAPIRARSSSGRTSAASTATPSCCCGRCSRSSAIGS